MATHTLPPLREIEDLIDALIGDIADDDRVEDCDEPAMDVTIGVDPDGSWSYQTGDNSFTGGAYGFSTWAHTTITRDSDPCEVARDLREQVADVWASDGHGVLDLTADDIAWLEEAHAAMMEPDEDHDPSEPYWPDGPDVVMTSIGYVELWADGEVVSGGVLIYTLDV